jgi:hypothetical protein
VLWIFGGPSGCRMTDVSSHIACQEAEGSVFYISCNSVSTTTFAYSILRHILDVSDNHQANSITTSFLSTLLHSIFNRDEQPFRDDDSPTMIKTILNASGGELLEALTEAVGQMKKIEGKSIIIDGVDILGQEGAQLVQKICLQVTNWQATTSPKIKMLVTCQADPDIMKLVAGLIESTKGRQCSGTSYPLVVSLEYDKERQGSFTLHL